MKWNLLKILPYIWVTLMSTTTQTVIYGILYERALPEEGGESKKEVAYYQMGTYSYEAARKAERWLPVHGC